MDLTLHQLKQILPNSVNYVADSSTNTWSLTNTATAVNQLSPFYIYVTSTNGSSVTTLTKPTGTVSSKRLYLKSTTATGGASWGAVNSINGGSNTGWSFTTFVAKVIGSFSSFFFF